MGQAQPKSMRQLLSRQWNGSAWHASMLIAKAAK
jgi:hypothetical protein